MSQSKMQIVLFYYSNSFHELEIMKDTLTEHSL